MTLNSFLTSVLKILAVAFAIMMVKINVNTDSKDFITTVMDRRSIYSISKDIQVSDTKIQEIVELGIKYAPSPYNSQTIRAIILFKEHHEKFWAITTEILRAKVPPERLASTEAKMKAFGQGYGTILFFEDTAAIKELQEKYNNYADELLIHTQHSAGIVQFIVWAGLESVGLGASLQHYNPLVDKAVQKEWNVPTNWKLIAQMPFGQPLQPPTKKEFQPVNERIKVFN